MSRVWVLLSRVWTPGKQSFCKTMSLVSDAGRCLQQKWFCSIFSAVFKVLNMSSCLSLSCPTCPSRFKSLPTELNIISALYFFFLSWITWVCTSGCVFMPVFTVFASVCVCVYVSSGGWKRTEEKSTVLWNRLPDSFVLHNPSNDD